MVGDFASSTGFGFSTGVGSLTDSGSITGFGSPAGLDFGSEGDFWVSAFWVEDGVASFFGAVATVSFFGFFTGGLAGAGAAFEITVDFSSVTVFVAVSFSGVFFFFEVDLIRLFFPIITPLNQNGSNQVISICMYHRIYNKLSRFCKRIFLKRSARCVIGWPANQPESEARSLPNTIDF
jgi:hypothetical protein